jgi:hypothetical protein
MNLKQHTIEQRYPRLDFLVRQFRRGMERQHQRDTETLTSIVRVLNTPRGVVRTDAERFTEFLRGIVKHKLDGRTLVVCSDMPHARL